MSLPASPLPFELISLVRLPLASTSSASTTTTTTPSATATTAATATAQASEGPLKRTLGSASALFGSLSSLSSQPSASSQPAHSAHSAHSAQPAHAIDQSPPAVFATIDLCGNAIYAALSDGSLVHYAIDPILDSSNAELKTSISKSIQVSPTRKPIQSMLSIPTESKLAVLADGVLSFYRLDTLSAVPPAQMLPVKGVTAFCADKTIQSPLSLTVAKRRFLSNYALDSQLTLQKDVSMIDGALVVAQDRLAVCAADAQSYKIVRLDRGDTIPLFPYEKSQMAPVVVVIGGGEFLIVTASAQGMGLGVFISSSGDPIRGTLQWPAVPISMVFQFPYVIALLRNNVLQIHNFKTQDLVQSITFPSDAPARCLACATYPLEISIAVSQMESDAESTAPTADAAAADADTADSVSVAGSVRAVSPSPVSDTGNERDTPAPAVPAKHAANGDASGTDGAGGRDSRELIPGGSVQVIIGFREEILGLRMIPWQTQVEQLLDSRRFQQAVTLGEQMLKQDEDTPVKKTTLARLYIRAALGFIQDAQFQSALVYVRKGRLDPRALVHLFHDLRPASCVAVPDGNATRWIAKMPSISDIVASAVARDHPDADADMAASVQTALAIEAKDMLASYLAEYRRSKLFRPENREAVDTTLLKMYAESNVPAMYDLLSGSHYCDVDECTPVLASHGRHFGLSLLFKSRGMYKDVLDVWTRIAGGEVVDTDFAGMQLIVELLVELDDQALVWRYAEWVLRRDPLRGVKVFTERTDGMFESTQVLQLLESYGSRALKVYIEHLVRERGSLDGALHTRLAILYMDTIVQLATDETMGDMEKRFRDRRTRRPTFLALMRDLRDPLTLARLAFIDFVQSSAYVDVADVVSRLTDERGDLHIERAILLSRMGDHEGVLDVYALRLGDFDAAESYCLAAGHEPRDAHAPALASTSAKASTLLPSLTVTLLHRLISMYIKASSSTLLPPDRRSALANETAYLLTTYAASLNAVRILAEIPDTWGLAMVSPFVLPVVAANLHARRQQYLVRALARGENLQVRSKAIDAMTTRPPIMLSKTAPALCGLCQRPVRDPTLFVWRASTGDVVHYQCSTGSAAHASVGHV